MVKEGIKVNMTPSHPGDFIRTEIIDELGLSVTKAAEILDVRQAALSDLLNGHISMSAEMALRVEKAFGVSMNMLLRMQAWYDASQMSVRSGEITVQRFQDSSPKVTMSSVRNQVAKVWHESASLTRKDLFGPGDELRPEYQNSQLNWQIDVPAVGLVGKHYEPGGLALLSVNPAGGKDDFTSNSLSDKVYERSKDLQRPGNIPQRFEASNKAIIASIPEWGFTKRMSNMVLEASGKRWDDISFLYLVPFRIRGDGGSRMNRKYLDSGYTNHLRVQLKALSPGHIIAMDRPSEKAASTYETEPQSKMKVIYFTGKHDAHAERKQMLKIIRREFS